MASGDFQVDDLVWAKMKGYPPWPAKIAEPLPDAKPPKNKKAQFVYFFGTKNFAWILDENITPHSESVLDNVSKKKSAPYLKAIEELINFSKINQKDKQSSPKKVTSSGPKKGENIPKKEKKTVPKKEKESISEKDGENTSKKEKEIVPKKEKEIVPKKQKEIPKKEKESSPKKSGRDAKKSQTKVVKSVSKKRGRKALTSSKASEKVSRKRPLDSDADIEPNAFTFPKIQKFEIKEDPLDGSTPPHYPNSDAAGISTWDDDDDDDSKSFSDPYFPDQLGPYNASIRRKHVLPTRSKIGFIGLGHIGKGIVINLLRSGHNVTVWNKTTYKCEFFTQMGARKVQSPAELVLACDIIFCSVSDPEASKSIIFGDRGILKGLDQAEKLGMGNKGYVEMTTIDPDTSKEIDEVIARKGGRYLEAPICGNSQDAMEGTLLILASGNRDLFLECETCFHAMGKHAYFVSCDAGFGSKMSLLLSMFSGTVYAAVAEALILAKRLSLPENDFLTILSDGPLQCHNIIEKSKRMMKSDFKTVTPLKHVQKDLNLTLSLGNIFSQPMPVTAAANEVYKHARLLQYSDFDVSAVYQGIRY